MIRKRLPGSPAGAVLSYLQRRGCASVKDLESCLGVTATAVRQQIANLQAQGYIQQELERKGRGRPKYIYSLTSSGKSLFPHHYDELTHSLLREILVSDGPDKVVLLLARMSQRLADGYSQQIDGRKVAERAQALSELLNAKGILSEIEDAGDSIVFREYNCPYYELAREYRAHLRHGAGDDLPCCQPTRGTGRLHAGRPPRLPFQDRIRKTGRLSRRHEEYAIDDGRTGDQGSACYRWR